MGIRTSVSMTVTSRPATSPAAPAIIDPAGDLARLFESLTAPATQTDSYRTFLEALAVAVYTTDAAGRITYFNQAAVDLWGRRPELGEEWCGSLRLFHLDGRPMAHADCPMAIALRENRPVRGSTAIAERPDGRKVAFEPFPTPLRAADGTLIGVVNVLVDVTERMAAEEALRATATALEASNTVKDEFLGLISHELRTPVTTIFGNAVVLRERGDLADVEREMVGDIGEDSERLLRIVENLLQLTRLGSGDALDLEPQVLDHLVAGSVDAFRRRHPARAITMTRARPSSVVEADSISVELVLQNLLSNADKYSPTTEPIEVTVGAVDGEARVEVLDRGIGLPDGDADEIFTAFFRSAAARRTASGMGVGLAVCKRIVEAQGGTIWARPRDGGGTVIGFGLPIHDDPDVELDDGDPSAS
jgi:two-component system, chemotaxis family, CheB/CheR fusion protein